MKISKIAEAMGYIDDDLITASIDYKPRKIRMKWIPYAAVACAACFCILAVRISENIPNNAGISSDSGIAAGGVSSTSTPPVSESSGNVNNGSDNSNNSNISDTSNNSNTSGDPVNSSVDKPGSSKPENPGNSSGENSGSSKPENPTSGDNTGSGKPVYDEVYKGTGGAFTGMPMTYDEIADFLTNDPKHPEWDTDSLYLVETIKVLSLDECRALAGWDDNYGDRVMYKVKVQKDLISGETVDRVENIFISMGNIVWQQKGDPIYAPGERFTVVLTKPYEGCDFLRTPAAFAFRYDAVEENGEIMLYSRRSDLDKLNMPTSVNIEESVVTSTTKNPAIYSQKLTLTAFADYLREDFKKRGLTSHFDNEPSNNPSETNQDSRNISNTEPAEKPNAYLSTKFAKFSTAKEQVKFVDIKEVSGADFLGYELDYVMPAETLVALKYVYTDGYVSVMDNSGDCVVNVNSPEHYEKIERDGMVFWKSLIHDSPAAIYISESDTAYIGTFYSDTDLSKAIDRIKSLV